MKPLLQILFFICLSNFCFGQNICNVDLMYVDKNINTPYRISCNNFEAAFAKAYKQKIIKSKKLLNELRVIFKSIVFTKDDEALDIRVKLVIQYANSKKRNVLCMDAFDDILVNGRLIKTNKQLKDFINKLCN